jgi:uncharacterized Tic20 family protein
MPTQEEKIWGAVSHLSYLSGLPILVPLIIFLWKREQSPFVAAQAKQAVGMHIATVIAIALAIGFSFATVGFGMVVAIPALSLFGVLAFVFSIIAVIKIAQGESYHYPVFGDWVDRL